MFGVDDTIQPKLPSLAVPAHMAIFNEGFATRCNRQFCIGQTGSLHGRTVRTNEAWASQLANVDPSDSPQVDYVV